MIKVNYDFNSKLRLLVSKNIKNGFALKRKAAKIVASKKEEPLNHLHNSHGNFKKEVEFFSKKTKAMLKTYRPMPESFDALKGDEKTEVKKLKSHYVFSPRESVPKSAFIFYPGASIQTESYSKLAKSLSEENHEVFLVNPLANMPLLFYGKFAMEIIQNHPETKTWSAGGHSLGGIAASKLVFDYPDLFKYLILYASYPIVDISDTRTKVLSITASHDGIITKEKLDKAKLYSPDGTTHHEIIGGNHCGFGYYGYQEGDNKSKISREVQHAEVHRKTVEFLNQR